MDSFLPEIPGDRWSAMRKTGAIYRGGVFCMPCLSMRQENVKMAISLRFNEEVESVAGVLPAGYLAWAVARCPNCGASTVLDEMRPMFWPQGAGR